MRVLERQKDNYRNVHVPLEVIRWVWFLNSTNFYKGGIILNSYIDEGKNPELYSKHQLEQTLAKYQAVGKKVEAYKVNCSITFS